MNLEQRIQKIYSNIYKKARPLIRNKLKAFVKEDEAQRQRLANGEITPETYKSWLRTQLLLLPEMQEVYNLIIGALDNANQQVVEMLQLSRVDEYKKGSMLALAMIGAGLVGLTMGARQSRSIVAGALKIGMNVTVKDVGPDVTKITKANVIKDFYNKEAFERMANSTESFLPKPSEKTLLRIQQENLRIWNKQKLNSKMIQGLSQGKAVPKIAKGLEQTFDMNKSQAIRNARTMTTAMRNKATMDRAREAVAAGIPVFKTWKSTSDSRTRDSHIHLNGEKCELEERFSNGLLFPGDPDGVPAEVYNCRCTLIIEIDRKKFKVPSGETGGLSL